MAYGDMSTMSCLLPLSSLPGKLLLLRPHTLLEMTWLCCLYRLQSLDGLLENRVLFMLLLVRDSSKTLPKLFNGFSKTGDSLSLISKCTSLQNFPLTKARFLDFTDLKAIHLFI